MDVRNVSPTPPSQPLHPSPPSGPPSGDPITNIISDLRDHIPTLIDEEVRSREIEARDLMVAAAGLPDVAAKTHDFSARIFHRNTLNTLGQELENLLKESLALRTPENLLQELPTKMAKWDALLSSYESTLGQALNDPDLSETTRFSIFHTKQEEVHQLKALLRDLQAQVDHETAIHKLFKEHSQVAFQRKGLVPEIKADLRRQDGAKRRIIHVAGRDYTVPEQFIRDVERTFTVNGKAPKKQGYEKIVANLIANMLARGISPEEIENSLYLANQTTSVPLLASVENLYRARYNEPLLLAQTPTRSTDLVISKDNKVKVVVSFTYEIRHMDRMEDEVPIARGRAKLEVTKLANRSPQVWDTSVEIQETKPPPTAPPAE